MNHLKMPRFNFAAAILAAVATHNGRSLAPMHRTESGFRNCPQLAHRRKKLKGWQRKFLKK